MRQFVVEFDFIGVTKEKVDVLLLTYGLEQKISAKGLWSVIDCGTLLGPGNKEYPTCKLVTPLLTLPEINDLKWVMERIYDIGAMVAPFEPVKIHFLGDYSYRYAKKIIKHLVACNKMLFTFILYSNYSSLLPSDSQFHRLSDNEKLYHYKILIDKIEDKAERREVEDLVYKIIESEAKPLYYKKP